MRRASMASGLVDMLTTGYEGVALSATDAEAAAQFIEPSDDPRSLEQRALELGMDVQHGAVVRSRRLGNWIVNWKGLVFRALPALVAGAAGTAANPFVGAAALLGAVYILVDVGTITFSQKHSAVIVALWKDHDGINPVRHRELVTTLAPQVSESELGSVLNDLARLGVIARQDGGQLIEKRDVLYVKYS
jgi:hypothetical protein